MWLTFFLSLLSDRILPSEKQLGPRHLTNGTTYVAAMEAVMEALRLRVPAVYAAIVSKTFAVDAGCGTGIFLHNFLQFMQTHFQQPKPCGFGIDIVQHRLDLSLCSSSLTLVSGDFLILENIQDALLRCNLLYVNSVLLCPLVLHSFLSLVVENTHDDTIVVSLNPVSVTGLNLVTHVMASENWFSWTCNSSATTAARSDRLYVYVVHKAQ